MIGVIRTRLFGQKDHAPVNRWSDSSVTVPSNADATRTPPIRKTVQDPPTYLPEQRGGIDSVRVTNLRSVSSKGYPPKLAETFSIIFAEVKPSRRPK